MSENGDGTTVPTVAAYGEPDDHLRMTVLIAEALRAVDPEASEVCLRGRANPWSQRRDALRAILGRAALRRRQRAPLLRVRDLSSLPDLATTGGRWDDERFERERGELRAALNEAIHEGVVSRSEASGGQPDGTLVDQYPEDLRPVARWLLAGGHLSEFGLREALRLKRPRHVLVAMWDVISWPAGRAALRLSAFRAPQKLNGTFGPLPLCEAGDEDSLTAIRRDAVAELLAMGLLRRDADDAVYFPRAMRRFFRACATEHPQESLVADHRLIARTLVPASTGQTLEKHYHAVHGLDEATALDTAKHYGADLRTIARGASLRREYDRAAAIYERIVREFDPNDAYAWEYLGYNLWWPFRDKPSALPEETRTRIEDALERACVRGLGHERNPLYLGRLVGFRGWLGQSIDDELTRWVQEFARDLPRQPIDEQTSLSWFAAQVQRALTVAGRASTWAAFCERWKRGTRTRQILSRTWTGEDE